MSTLTEERASAVKAAKDIVAKAKAENRELTEEEAAEVDTHLKAVEDLDAKKAKADADAERLKRLGALKEPEAVEKTDDDDKPAKSLGDHVVKAIGERLKGKSGSRFTLSAPAYKAQAATDVHVTGGDTGALGPVLTQVDTNIVTGVRRRLTIADLLGQGVITGQAITYFVEGAMAGDFTTVAESGQKPQINYALPTAVTEALSKIAAFIKESDEMVEDLPFMVSAINNRLLYNLALFEEGQLLSGNGTGTNLTGLLNRSGIQTETAASVAAAGDDNADAVFRAMTKVATGSGLDADGVVINPTDYQALRLSRDSNGQYFGGGFFAGQYGNGGVPMQPPLWGLRTVVTPAITAGTVLVGAFQQSSTLYRKGGVRVEATNSDEDDFTNNRVTVRAEERVALAVRRPSGLVKVTLDNTAPA